jgi:hypothetical protein
MKGSLAKRFRVLEIDEELQFGGLLNRQIARKRAV